MRKNNFVSHPMGGIKNGKILQIILEIAFMIIIGVIIFYSQFFIILGMMAEIVFYK